MPFSAAVAQMHPAVHLFLQANGPVQNNCSETNSLSGPLDGAKVIDAGASIIYILDISRTIACCAYKRNNLGWQILLCHTGISNIWMDRSFHYLVHPFSYLIFLPFLFLSNLFWRSVESTAFFLMSCKTQIKLFSSSFISSLSFSLSLSLSHTHTHTHTRTHARTHVSTVQLVQCSF